MKQTMRVTSVERDGGHVVVTLASRVGEYSEGIQEIIFRVGRTKASTMHVDMLFDVDIYEHVPEPPETQEEWAARQQAESAVFSKPIYDENDNIVGVQLRDG